MKTPHLVLSILLMLLAAAYGATKSRPPRPQFREARIRSYVTFLADDQLEGRGTGTRGFEIAARYVASQFSAYGLEPAGVDGFYQRVRFQYSTPVAEQSTLSIVRGATSEAMQWGRDFVAIGNVARSPLIITAPIAFVGYGINAPEDGHDDYASDVKGKIVAFLPGVPANLPQTRREYYTSQKWRAARQQGAIATMELSTPGEDTSWPWNDRVLFAGEGKGTALDDGGALREGEQLPRIILSTDATARLFQVESRSLPDTIATNQPVQPAIASFTFVTQRTEMSSPHVIGAVRGSDPRVRNEYVVVIAHLDGQGRGKAVNGDDIYNSAIDNGLGAALLLGLADAFSASTARPKRSILFIASTGEELGIAGSPYFVEHPTVPLEAMVAAINIDGPSLLTDSLRAVLAMGAENSTLGATVRGAAQQLALRVKSADAPLNYSDHYPFVMKGIPALWIVGDNDGLPQSAEAAAVQRSIHKPNDDMNRVFRWAAAVRLAELNYLIASAVANQPDRPRWNRGDILGAKFGQSTAR